MFLLQPQASDFIPNVANVLGGSRNATQELCCSSVLGVDITQPGAFRVLSHPRPTPYQICNDLHTQWMFLLQPQTALSIAKVAERV